MKKIIIHITALLALSCSLMAETKTAITEDGSTVILYQNGTWKTQINTESKKPGSFHFRKSNWGDSKEKVIESEDLEPKHDADGVLGFQAKIAGLDTILAYIFVENKLVRSKYIITEKHTNANDFISDYEKLKEALTRKYGTPDKDETFWKNDLYKDDYEDWGMALKVGHLVYLASWETTDTDIGLVLSGENYDISLQIEYTSKKLEALEDKKTEQEKMNAL
jgi:hypothetical protein